MKHIKLGVAFAAGVLLINIFGCAAVNEVPMQPEAKKLIKSSNVVVGINQQEIYAEINHSNTTAAMGGGLLFALIDSAVDSSRTSDAEELIKPIRNALIDYNFSRNFSSAMKKELKGLDWMKLRKLNVDTNLDPAREETIRNSSKDSIVMFADTRYYLSADFSALNIITNVRIYPKTKELMDVAKKIDGNNAENPLLYKHTLMTIQPLKNAAGTPEERIEAWTKKDSHIRDALNRGIAQISMDLVEDLERKREEAKEKLDTASLSTQ